MILQLISQKLFHIKDCLTYKNAESLTLSLFGVITTRPKRDRRFWRDGVVLVMIVLFCPELLVGEVLWLLGLQIGVSLYLPIKTKGDLGLGHEMGMRRDSLVWRLSASLLDQVPQPAAVCFCVDRCRPPRHGRVSVLKAAGEPWPRSSFPAARLADLRRE